MKIAIVDDKQEELDNLSSLLKEKINNHNIYTFISGEKFLEQWQKNFFDIIILDIYMDKINGIEVARTIRKVDDDVRIVFCTTSNDFASESYEVNAQFYLRKPYTSEQVNLMISRLNIENYELKRSLILPDGQKVMLRNIIYTNYSNHVITIHQKEGEDIRCYMTQSDAESLFCQFPYFIVPSKGIIVNLHEVTNRTNNAFHLTNNKIVPISRRKNKEVEKQYAEFCFKKLRKEI